MITSSLKLPRTIVPPTVIRRHYAVATSSSSSPEDQELLLNFIEKENQGKIAVLAFNRPQAKNAFGRNVVTKFIEYVDILRFEKDVRALIIRSVVPGKECKWYC